MPYYLYDDSDRGDCGPMSLAISYNSDTNEYEVEHDARPRVGVQMRVGSITARSYEAQDWWQCTDIKEIIEESEHKVVFRTRNSTYTWRKE